MSASPSLHPTPRQLDIDTLAEFDAHAAEALAHRSRSGRARGWHVQSVDLRERGDILGRLDLAGAVFLGCELPAGFEDRLRSGGALVFPAIPGTPFDAYRGDLYTAAELYDGVAGAEYESTPDARIYAWSHHHFSGGPGSLDAALAATLHDHAVGGALDAALATGPLAGRPVVGVMGGHAAERGTAGYRQAARLGRDLARAGYTVATGGGPGAMEAANLGAYLSGAPDPALEEALGTLAATPSFRPSITAWARTAAAVLAEHPAGVPGLGIPTWFYGHEPPNMFATHIAKYFANAIREAVLLSKCDGGIVVLPGAAGTVQEIFQDACENYYGTEQTITPLVLVGVEHWTGTLPAWPLLRALAAGRDMEDMVHLVDTPGEAVAVLRDARRRGTGPATAGGGAG